MSRAYSPEEIREAADNFWVGGVICEVKDDNGRVAKHIKHDAVIAMLRQAADILERGQRVISANSKERKYRHKDADAVLETAEYIISGVRR